MAWLNKKIVFIFLRKKTIFIFLRKKTIFIFLFGFLAGNLFWLLNPSAIEIISQPASISLSPSTDPQKEITVLLTGDIMLDRGVEYKIKNEGKEDFDFPFLKIVDDLKEADILFGNLESVISDKGKRIGTIYSFRADPRAIDGLVFAGFNVLSLANNHALDYDRPALEDTLKRLKEAGIDYVGAGLNEEEAKTPIIKEIEGTKIAFLAFTNFGPEFWKPEEKSVGIRIVSKDDFAKIKEEIRQAKEKADILIVSLHAGEEYSQEITAFQEDFAHLAIDAGADLVVGHHPHVVQKEEDYQGKKIFYGLGNFVFDQGFSEKTMEGQIVKLVIQDKKIKETTTLKTKINKLFQPEIQN